jgi:hypothetical protein
VPYAASAQQRLPYQSNSDTSHDAAVMMRDTGRAATQCRVMAAVYRELGAVADYQMALITGYPITSICARRSDLHCVKAGRRMGPHGVQVTTWGLAKESTC